jgi:hypothetical protein
MRRRGWCSKLEFLVVFWCCTYYLDMLQTCVCVSVRNIMWFIAAYCKHFFHVKSKFQFLGIFFCICCSHWFCVAYMQWIFWMICCNQQEFDAKDRKLHLTVVFEMLGHLCLGYFFTLCDQMLKDCCNVQKNMRLRSMLQWSHVSHFIFMLKRDHTVGRQPIGTNICATNT